MIKKYFLLLLLGQCLFGNSQNGLISYSCTLKGGGSGGGTGNFFKRSAFVVDNNGNKWIGLVPSNISLANFELIRFNGTTWDSLPHVPSRKVNALAVDVTNNLWIGTDSGLVMYNGTSYTIYNTGNSSIISNTVNCITIGGGNIYVGTNAGLSVFNGSSFSNYNNALNGLSHDLIYSIAYESASAVWLGHAGGLEKFNGSTFSYDSLGIHGQDKINCIYIDQQGNKWLGTNNNGAVKFDNNNFYTMPQIYGPNAIVGGSWPTDVHSIGSGPNGGVSFTIRHERLNFFDCAGIIEISSSNYKLYRGIGIDRTISGSPYSLLVYDNFVNKLFYVSTILQSPPRTFTYSFDASQYVDEFPIVEANSAFLDINNVSALITANSDFGWDGESSRYYVPKTNYRSPLRSAASWIGGYNNGNLHLASMTYRQSGLEFWPGPLDTVNGSIDTATSLLYNQVWKVNRFDIANFIYNWNAGNVQSGGFIPAASIINWPAHGPGAYSKRLAPFVDVNSDGIYSPLTDGDYPLIKGDQMIWRVINDNLGPHTESGGLPMKVEIQQSSYAFVCPSIADSNRAINYTTFHNCKIINRSSNQYDSCHFSNWMNTELGNRQDDYIGCDVANNFGYAMNGDNYDEDYSFLGTFGYYDYLPILACNILNGPKANPSDGRDNNNNGVVDEPNENCLMNSFTYYTNTGDQYTGNPRINFPTDYYNFMHGVWRNGLPMTYGGNGVNLSSADVCRHLFPGNSDPNGYSMGGTISNPIPPPGNFGSTGWTMQQANVLKNDMRFITGIGPFTMQPGRSYEVDYALVFTQDSINCYGDTVIGPFCTLPRAQQDNIRVKRWFDNNSFPSCLSLVGVGIKEQSTAFDFKLYPNPAVNYLFIESAEWGDKTTVEAFDITGKLVKAGTFMGNQKYISLPVEDLAPGVYVVKVKSGQWVSAKRFIKQ